MTFTAEQQAEHRAQFIKECRQKSWGALCHADWTAQQVDRLVDQYINLQGEERELNQKIETSKLSPGSHTEESRKQRDTWKDRLATVKKTIEGMGRDIEITRRTLAQYYQVANTSMSLAEYAEKWSWQELSEKAGTAE